MRKLLLVHGASSYSRPNLMEKWVPELKETLGDTWQIVLPEMPKPEAPSAGAWLRAVDEVVDAMGDDVALVGHSLGGSVLLQHAARRRRPPRCLFAVAAPFWCGADVDWQHPEFGLTDSEVAALQAVRLTFYHGTTDEIVPYRHLSMYLARFPSAEARSYEGMNHIDPSTRFLRDLASDVVASGGGQPEPFRR